MQCVSIFAALALVLGAGQTMACENGGCAIGDRFAPTECNSVGCVRPTSGFEKLANVAGRRLSERRLPKSASAWVCSAVNCAIEPTETRLPERCGSAGCAMPEAKARPAAATANGAASLPASILVTDVFAAVTKPPMRLPRAVPWTEWAERSGFGALYQPPPGD